MTPRVAAIARYFDAVQAYDLGDTALLPTQTRLIASVRLACREQVDVDVARTPSAHGWLVDAYVPGVPGGAGELLDLDLAAHVVRTAMCPVIIAGGLSPANVAGAIRQTRPFAVDVSSGVEIEKGAKDPVLIREFCAAVRAADRALESEVA